MGKYFGTDGFRGEANCNLTADHAFKVGRFLGWYYTQLKRRSGSDGSARIVIGKDTRRVQPCWRSGSLRRGRLSAPRHHHPQRGLRRPH